MSGRPEPRDRLLAVIAAVLVVAALKWGYPVAMPVAAAALLVAAVWPVKTWLDRRFSPRLGSAGALLVLVSVLAAFGAAASLCVSEVTRTFAMRQDRFRRLYEAYADWAGQYALPVPGEGGGGFGRLLDLAGALAQNAYAGLGYVGLIAVLVLFGLPEVPALRRKLHGELDAAERHEVSEAAGRIAGKIRAYVGVMALTSLITGVASAAWASAVGLDLALVWGVLNLLLNFVPIVGNLVGIVPPTLYALVQFEGWTMPLVVFAGFAVLQAAISNVLEPWMQGGGLSLSPVAVVVALAFWGWLWGAAGALLAVPLTAALVIVCEHFDAARWFAKLLSNG